MSKKSFEADPSTLFEVSSTETSRERKRDDESGLDGDEFRLARRGFLALGCVACGVGACGTPVTTDGGPDATDAPPPDSVLDADDVIATDGGDGGPVCAGVDLGPLSDFPVGSNRFLNVSGLKVVVRRNDTGVWAHYGECQHFQGSLMPRMSDGFAVCNNTNGGARLHGAVYDLDGTNVVGPGASPINGMPQASYQRNNFRVRICEGRVVVDPGEVVPIGTRTPVT